MQVYETSGEWAFVMQQGSGGSTTRLREIIRRPRLHESGQIFARTNFVPGWPVYMDPCRIRANSVAVVFTRIRAKFRPVAAFDSRP